MNRTDEQLVTIISREDAIANFTCFFTQIQVTACVDIELLSQSYSGTRFALKKLILSHSRQRILLHQIRYHLSFISSLFSHKAQIQSHPFRVLQLISKDIPGIMLPIICGQDLHNYPSSAHMSSSSRSLADCAARGISDIGPRCGRCSPRASNNTELRGTGVWWRPSLSSSERSRSMSRLTPARRAADKSIGFGRAKIDCPDLCTPQ
jgi:hypothetical protein